MTYGKKSVSEAADIILGTGSVLILCHTNPDGDTLGSAVALKRIFESLGKKATVRVPSSLPEYVKFIAEGLDLGYKDGEEKNYDKVISVDVAAKNQLGELSHLAESVDFMIDHHASGTPFADNLIVPDASAAGEIVFDIYKELIKRGKLASSPDICRPIFAAISSDTGSFKYSNTTPKTFAVASELTETINSDKDGLSTSDISKIIHDTVTELEMKVNLAVADRIELYCGGALAICPISAELIRSLGADESNFGGAVDVVRSLKGVIVALTVREKPDGSGTYKISARSCEDINVAEICSSFGGGGHVRAAGATLRSGSIDEAKSSVLSAFTPALEKFLASHGERHE